MDAYPILVSEVMLQQTQVRHVLGYFDAWMGRFPNWQALADASNADVLEAWSGLGYNRRALSLKSIAQQVVEHGLPESYDEWIALKGIGPYTASALSVFSLQIKHLPIDTNIRRVLGRIYLGLPYPQLTDDAAIQSTAGSILDTDRFVDVPQALFDLANTHCLKTPDCESCPLKNACAASGAFLSGSVTPPKRMTPKPKERVHPGKQHPDRIYRGRILKYIRTHHPANTRRALTALGRAIDPTFTPKTDHPWLAAMLSRLTTDGLIRLQAGRYTV